MQEPQCGSARDARDEASYWLWLDMLTAPDGTTWTRAREELYRQYEELAFSFGKGYMRHKRLDPDDIRQCCRIGLVRAIDAWDPVRSKSLTTMIAYRVKEEIRTWLRAEGVYSKSDQEDDSQEECQPKTKAQLRYVSYDAARNNDAPEASCHEFYTELSVPSHEQQVVMEMTVATALGVLAPEQRQMVELCHGLNGNDSHGLDEISEALNLSITRQAINFRLKRAYRRMRPLVECAS